MEENLKNKVNELRQRYYQKFSIQKEQMDQKRKETEENFMVIRNDLPFKGKTPYYEQELKYLVEMEFHQSWNQVKHVLESKQVYCIRDAQDRILVIWKREACLQLVGKILIEHELIDTFEARVLYGIKPCEEVIQQK